MKAISEFSSEKINNYSEIGSWTYYIECEREYVTTDLVKHFLMVFEEEFRWVKFSKASIYVGDESIPFLNWNKDHEKYFIRFVSEVEIKVFEDYDTIIHLDLDVLFNENEKVSSILEGAYLLLGYDQEKNRFYIIFTININLFTKLIWSYDRERNKKVDLVLGDEFSEENRRELEDSLKGLFYKLNLCFHGCETDSVSDIHQFGFTKESIQFRF